MLVDDREAEAELGECEDSLGQGRPPGGDLDLANGGNHVRVALEAQERVPDRGAVRQHVHNDIPATHAAIADLMLHTLASSQQYEVLFAQSWEVCRLRQRPSTRRCLGGGQGVGGGLLLQKRAEKKGGGRRTVLRAEYVDTRVNRKRSLDKQNRIPQIPGRETTARDSP